MATKKNANKTVATATAAKVAAPVTTTAAVEKEAEKITAVVEKAAAKVAEAEKKVEEKAAAVEKKVSETKKVVKKAATKSTKKEETVNLRVEFNNHSEAYGSIVENVKNTYKAMERQLLLQNIEAIEYYLELLLKREDLEFGLNM